MTFVLVILSLFFIIILRIVWVLTQIRRGRKRGVAAPRRVQPVKTLIVLGSGGHTTEMIMLTQHLDPKHYSPIEYCKASSDTTSVMRLPTSSAIVHDIPRARHVGQSYWTSIITTLYAQVHALWLLARIRPQLILCNGPGTCLPLCVAAFLFRILMPSGPMVVFIESYCRVETLSLTGRLLYPWVDLFVVHWPELHKLYPNSVVVKTFVS